MALAVEALARRMLPWGPPPLGSSGMCGSGSPPLLQTEG
jgi:hypothetical protein